ncbi:MAG: roadblock/LC7 domain-containing protein [Deferrisomatales bacterium]
MADLAEALGRLAEDVGGAQAALVLEVSGLEVASWGHGDFEALAAEVAELWRQLAAASELGAAGPVGSLEVLGARGTWVAVPLGQEYLLAVLGRADVPPGKLRFHAGEWAGEHRGEFA